MKLLVLGGTQFVGRHIVEAALARGHAVTLFHRGKTNPGLFPQGTEEILGDRDGGLGQLQGGTWDQVLDVNGYVPRLVRDSVRALSAAAERYLYISTLSVLADHSVSGQTESTPRVSFEGVTTEEITGETYGPLKAACEAVVEREAAGRSAILRPGFIVGPWDHTGRFNYWLRRASEGGAMLVPGSPDAPVQFIDARDLAAFVLRTVEEKMLGTYHTVGPREPWTWSGLFEECGRVTGADTRVTWVPEKFLDACAMRPGELPMRFRGSDGLARTNCAKAVARGLTFRPVGDTIRDTLAWDALHGRHDVGLSPEREREVLLAWEQVKEAA
jgi:2'-hydroxyisoflavone reductase